MSCPHNSDDVVADINQGDAVYRHDHGDYKTQWCRRCGSYRHTIDDGRFTEWRIPKMGAIR